MMKQLPNIITSGFTFVVDFIKEEDLMMEALITLAVLSFLVIIL